MGGAVAIDVTRMCARSGLGLSRALVFSVLLVAKTAHADPEPPGPPLAPNRASPSMDVPDLSPSPRTAEETSELLVPSPAEWSLKYEEARQKLLTGEFADAAVRFAELESKAVNRVDRATARAQRTLADEWTSRGLTFVHRSDLADPAVTAKAVDKRSTDELVSLYTNAVVYGIGSGVWLGTLTDPKTPAGGILPALALTAGSVGTVLALDSGRGFRYGVPQSIVSGMWIGLEHGVVWTVWHNSRDNQSEVSSKTAASIIWGLTTIGAVGGGVLGETLGTTPGRSAWVGSTALWTGALFGFATGGVVKDGATEGLAAAGVGLTTGTAIGLLSASTLSPSIARVRLIDLAGLLGGVSAAALYAAGANQDSTAQATSAITALGIAGGLVIGFVATSSMASDRLRTPEAKKREDSAARSPLLAHMRPMLMPSQSGGMIGLGGTLD